LRTELLSLTTLAIFSHIAEIEPVGHEANGFGRRYLHEGAVHGTADFWCPETLRLSTGGIPIPLVHHGVARKAAIHRHYWEVLMSEERNDPLWDPDNKD
jgi:hypothetical protein